MRKSFTPNHFIPKKGYRMLPTLSIEAKRERYSPGQATFSLWQGASIIGWIDVDHDGTTYVVPR